MVTGVFLEITFALCATTCGVTTTGGGGGTAIFGSGVWTGDVPSGVLGLPIPGFVAGLTMVLPGTVMVFVLVPPGTVPQGGPNPPAATVTSSDEVNSPDVTDTVVVPLLNAQNSPDVEDAVVAPVAVSLGNGEPGALAATKLPTTGFELVNE